MKLKKFVYIRFAISTFFLLTLLGSIFMKTKLGITSKEISYYGSYVISLYSMVYGVEKIFMKKFNLGIFLIVFGIMIIILNTYMIWRL